MYPTKFATKLQMSDLFVEHRYFKFQDEIHFYRAMHNSAKRGLAIACRLSVCPSVRDIGGSGPQRLEILEINCTDN